MTMSPVLADMQCLVLAHHNNRPRTEHVEEVP